MSLVATIISIVLAIILEILVWEGQRNNRILFADDVNSLPLNRTFGHLYFPDIVAVIYTML